MAPSSVEEAVNRILQAGGSPGKSSAARCRPAEHLSVVKARVTSAESGKQTVEVERRPRRAHGKFCSLLAGFIVGVVFSLIRLPIPALRTFGSGDRWNLPGQSCLPVGGPEVFRRLVVIAEEAEASK